MRTHGDRDDDREVSLNERHGGGGGGGGVSGFPLRDEQVRNPVVWTR